VLEDIETAIAYAREAEKIAHISIAELSNKNELFAAVSTFFIARALQSLLSSTLLSERGLIADAWSCNRSIIELDIEHAYIFLNDPSEKWCMYLDFDAISRKKFATTLKAIGIDIDGEEDAQLTAQATAAKIALQGDTRSWAGKGIDLRKGPRMAKSAGHDICLRGLMT
jgi:Family of unknown function (DUF5677)